MKKTNILNLFTAAILFAVIHVIAAVLGILQLPETVPTHFDMHWVCDGIGSKWNLLIIAFLPLILGGSMCAFSARKREKNKKVMSILSLLLMVFFSAMFWLYYQTAASGIQLGEQTDAQAIATVLPLLYAMLFIILGNYLPTIQPNHTLGLRVSWTLNNPQCWRVTHRFAGKLWVITGLLLCVFVLIGFLLHQSGKLWFFIVFFEMMTVNITVPCIYAYIHKDESTETAK